MSGTACPAPITQSNGDPSGGRATTLCEAFSRSSGCERVRALRNSQISRKRRIAFMPYNRSAAAEYARSWALRFNSGYHTYGNDCTNFVSQCLYCGGMPMVGDKSYGSRKNDEVWWYDWDAWTESGTASYSWAGAQNLCNFLGKSKRGILKTKSGELEVGDVIQMRKDNHVHHTMVVVQKHASDLLLCYHTDATLDKPLSDAKEISRRGIPFLEN